MKTRLKEETLIHIMEALLSIETMEELLDLEKMMIARALQLKEENPKEFMQLRSSMKSKIN